MPEPLGAIEDVVMLDPLGVVLMADLVAMAAKGSSPVGVVQHFGVEKYLVKAGVE
jgi:hypothetical protein